MPKKTAVTIDALRKLGYEVGFAHGSVEAEEQALEHARTQAKAEVLTEQAATVTQQTIGDLSNSGRLPNDPAQRRDLAARIADQALAHLTERAEGRVGFHEAALQIAKESPDVWVITGPGVTNVYVACKADGTGWDESQQELLDTLADKEAHAERVKQHDAAG